MAWVLSTTVTNSGSAGLLVEGNGDSLLAHFADCTVTDSGESGLLVAGSAVSVTDSRFNGNAYSAIEARNGAKPFIRNCTLLSQNQGTSILISDNSGGVVESCTITPGEKASGIELTRGATPRVSRNTFTHCASAVFIHDNGVRALARLPSFAAFGPYGFVTLLSFCILL